MSSSCGRGALGVAAMVALGGCELYMTPDKDEPSTLDAASFVDAPPILIDAGGFDAQPVNPGFLVPTDVTRANERINGTWQEVGLADWQCLNTPRSEPVPSQPMALTGVVRDFQNGGGVGGAVVRLLSRGNLLGSATTSNAPATRGDYRLQATQALPPGSSRVDLALDAPGFRNTLVLDRYLGPSSTVSLDPTIMSDATAQALPAFIGVTANPGTTLVVGSIRDCRGRMVSNTAVTVSSIATVPAHIGGATTFYFSAGSTSLPVRHTQAPVTNRDGRYLVLNVPPQGVPAFVQVWGFRSTAELTSGSLTLLGRSPAILQPDAVNSVETEPLRP